MKLIENSIEELQTEIVGAALEDNMASCDLALVNGVQSKKENSSETDNTSKVMHAPGITNTFCSSPIRTNGFGETSCEGEDDFELVLESSSEDDSPEKKILNDDEIISAPQIVQEIENILGIDSSNFNEELEKDLIVLDDSEKEDDIVDDCKTSSNDLLSFSISERDACQVANQALEESEKSLIKLSDNSVCDSSTKLSDESVCDSSSNMNLVYDEVEIGTCTAESSEEETLTNLETASKEQPLYKNMDSDCTQITDNNVKEDTINKLATSSKNDDDDLSQISEKINNGIVENQKAEEDDSNANIPLSQNTNLSDSSIEWNVIDSIESEEEEIMSPKKSCDTPESTREFEGKTNLDEKHAYISESPVHVMDMADTNSGANQTSVTSVTGGAARKRTASVSEENGEGKKAKLELETNKNNNPVAKRLSSEPTEDISFKRSKLKSDDNSSNTELTEEQPSLTNKPTENPLEKNETMMDCATIPEISSNLNDDVNTISPDILQETEKLTNMSEENQHKESINNSNNTTIHNLTMEENKNKDESLELGGVSPLSLESELTQSLSIDIKNKSIQIEEGKKEITEDNSADKKGTAYCQSKDNELPGEVYKSKENIPPSSDSNLTPSSDSNLIAIPLITEDTNNTTINLISLDPGPSKSLIKTHTDLENCSILNVDDSIKNKRVITNLDDASNKSTNSSIEENVASKIVINDLLDDDSNKTTISTAVENVPSASKSLVTIGSNKNNKSITKHNSLGKIKSIENDNQLNRPPMRNTEPPRKSKIVIKKDKNLNKTSSITDTTKSTALTDFKTKLNGQFHKIKSKLSKGPFEQLNKNLEQNKEQKDPSNLEKAIDSVVSKARAGTSVNLPILTKFHKSQLRRLTRSQLEEAIVVKVSEAITDRSDMGQLRVRCRKLEQNNELWKKKSAQFEKQNRELEMVLRRFMNDVLQAKRDNPSKAVLPIKVTRSVGLQVVLANSVHGSLASSNKIATEHREKSKVFSHSHKNSLAERPILAKESEKESVAERPKPEENVTQKPRGPGKPSKHSTNSEKNSPTTSTTPSESPKVTTPSTPLKTLVPKVLPTPTKDLEVIDLTEREEKGKSSPAAQPPAIAQKIRVAPTTQVCYVQPSSPSTTTTQPMTYLVQKSNPRQQYIVATTSPSPPRTVGTVTVRAPPLAVPVFRTAIQPHTPVGVKPGRGPLGASPRPPKVISLQTQVTVGNKHPAPLPATPIQVMRPGLRAAPPPKPQLKIAKTSNGIMLSWSMSLTNDIADMASYQLYAYQEGIQLPSTNLWKKVGDVKALPLPMACTLTQFIDGHKYHFAVRAVDVHGRIGPFSHPSTILLSK